MKFKKKLIKYDKFNMISIDKKNLYHKKSKFCVKKYDYLVKNLKI